MIDRTSKISILARMKDLRKLLIVLVYMEKGCIYIYKRFEDFGDKSSFNFLR